MNTQNRQIEEQFFELLCYMIVSARNLMQETKIYGPLRLVDATSRLIAILETHNIHLPESQVILEHIEEAKAGVGEGEQYFSSALERIVSDLLPIIMHRKKQEDK